MNDLLKSVVVALVAGIVAGALVLHFAPVSTKTVAGAASPSGSTFGTKKIASVTFAPSTGAVASSTFIGTNNNAGDNIVDSVQYSCIGLGAVSQTFANLTFQIATSSSASAFPSNTNYLLNTTVATTSNELFVASTTPGTTGVVGTRRWASGSSLLVQLNSTSTATCTVVVSYFNT